MKKKNKDQNLISSDPNTGTQTTPQKKSRRKRWTFRFIVLLLLCIIGIGIYDNLHVVKETTDSHPKKKGSLFVINKPDSIPVEPGDIVVPVINKDKKAALEIAKPAGQIELKNASLKPSVFIQEPDLKTIDDEGDDALNEKINHSEIIHKMEEEGENLTKELKKEIDKVLTNKRPDFTAQDALTFRDHFLSEQPCGEDFRKLMLDDDKNQTIKEVIKTTSYFCLTTTNVYGELQTLFNQAKKQALIDYYTEQGLSFMARIKVVLARLIKVRKLNPVGDTVPDLLDRAHNAMDSKNIALAVETIKELPQNIQIPFHTFLEKTNGYIDAKAALDALVLSYTKGE